MVINVYVTNARVPSYVKQISLNLKGEIDHNIIVVDTLYTLLILRNRLTRQILKKETSELTQTIEQMDFIEIYRIVQSTDTKCTSSPVHQYLEHYTDHGLIIL